MARESAVLTNIYERLQTIPGVRTYEQVLVDKWNTYQFDYVGILACEDSREVIGLEDDSAFSNKGTMDIYVLAGAQVKKQNNNRANLRERLGDLNELIENSLGNYKPTAYESDYETTIFAPLHFVSSQVATYSDDETKGLTLVVFRTIYYKGQS
jgi:hypothetical protein